MKIFRYRDLHVTDERPAEIRKKYGDTNDASKYYKFKEWLHYANLHAWRRDQWHFQYSTYDEGRKTYLCCTCGLQVLSNKVETIAIDASLLPNGLQTMSSLARVKYHVDFSNPSTKVSALIVDYLWDDESLSYFWTAYCQECLEYVLLVSHIKAVKFINEHNVKHN